MSSFFNVSNKLKDYSVTIGDKNIPKESLFSFEVSYTIHSPMLHGKLVFTDSFDLDMFLNWNDVSVKLKYTDTFDESVEKEFSIVNINEIDNGNKEKIFSIDIQDKFSYILSKSFKCKSFNSNPKDALLYYIDSLGLQDVKTDFTTNNDKFNFVIPNYKNNLESFLFEFHKYGYYFYQNKDTLILKTIDEVSPNILPLNGEFIDQTDNQLYANFIYDIDVYQFNKNKTPPLTRACAYNIQKKKMNYAEFNSIEEYSINDDKTNIQEQLNIKDLYQTHLDFNQNKNDMRESFFNQNQITIAVNGYSKNDLHQIYDINLKGNKSYIDGVTRGNVVIGGKYVSTKITDKIASDSMIQKITLNRVDRVKKDSNE